MLGFFIPMLCDESIVNRMHALFVCLLCMFSIARSCDVQDTCLNPFMPVGQYIDHLFFNFPSLLKINKTSLRIHLFTR